MQVNDLGARSSSTPAYSGNDAAKNTRQHMDSSIKIQDEVARMIELTSLEMPFDKAGLRGPNGKPTGQTPLETTGRYNKTQSVYN